MSEWREISSSYCRLEEDNEILAFLYRLPDPDRGWALATNEEDNYYGEFKANSLDEATWKATNYLCLWYNSKIDKLMKMRDHLPDIHALARKAGVI